eukprot:SAG22_NODE_57_length_23647_cov_11.746688_11_plen_152_part_00
MAREASPPRRGGEEKDENKEQWQKWMKEVDTEAQARLRFAKDSADLARTGGKRAAVVVPKAANAVLPSLPCLSLEEKDVDLAKLVHGKISLVAFGFQASSDAMILKFKMPFDEAFKDDKRFQFIEVGVAPPRMLPRGCSAGNQPGTPPLRF